VLSRKRNETIIIKGKDGEDIKIILVDTERNKSRIGIEAPKGYTIIRGELLTEIKDINKKSVLKDIEKEEIKRLINGQNK